MFTELKERGKGTGNLAPKSQLPAHSPHSHVLLQERSGRSWAESQAIGIQGPDPWPMKWWQSRGLRSPQMRHPLPWGMVSSHHGINSPPRCQTWQGHQGNSGRIPRPESHPIILLPVYRSRSCSSDSRGESRRLRNMSTHDITWKSWLLIGASYNLPGSHRKTGSL